jgi:hypothetical protein
MRRLFVTTVLIVISAVAGFAQSTLDVGYAVVTPSGGSPNMVVFQTFGFGTGAFSNQAGILPQPLVTNAAMFVSVSDRFSRDVGVAIVNPNTQAVTVTLTLRDENGAVLGSPLPVTVDPKNHVSRFVRQIFGTSVPPEITGTLIVTSPQPVGLAILRFRGATFSSMPITNIGTSSPVPVIATGVGGPGAALLAQFAAGTGWASEIIISNTGSTAITARVDIFRTDGTPMPVTMNGQRQSSFTNIPIPAGGVFVLRSGEELIF